MMVDAGDGDPDFVFDPAQNLHCIGGIRNIVPISNTETGDHGIDDDHP